MSANREISRRNFLGIGAVGTGALLVSPLPGLSSSPEVEAAILATTPPDNGPIDVEAAGGIDALLAAARSEGAFNTTVPLHVWQTYGRLFAAFKAKYPSIAIGATILANQ